MKTLVYSALALSLGSFPTIASAATLYNPLGTTNIPGIIGRVIQAVFGIVGAIALLMFVYGGFLMLTSGGEPGRIEKGQKTLLWATIGIAVIFGAYALSNFIITQLAGAAATGA